MIQIQRLIIHEFRGVRHLELDLKGKNFAVCGPNGTGKSGVVDALEFVLAGTISRLSGAGRGDLSVKDHGPHVDCRLTPEKAYVEVVVSAPSLEAPVTIRRTVKSPKAPTISPDSAEARALLKQMEDHPEIALSRREIIRYVLAEPGKRAKDVQALLKLDVLDDLRSKFLKIANAEKTAATTAERAKATAMEAFLRALGIASATTTEVLAVVNPQRKALGLEPLTTLVGDVSLKDGLATATETEVGHRIAKAAAAADLEAARVARTGATGEAFLAKARDAAKAVQALQADAGLLDAVTRDDFLRTALELYDGEACPACDTAKTAEEFTAVIGGKRDKLAAVRKLREDAEALIEPLTTALQSEMQLLRLIYPTAKSLLGAEAVGPLADHGLGLKGQAEALSAFVPLDQTLAALESFQAPPDLTELFDKVAGAIAGLPDPSTQDAARDFLITAQMRWDALRASSAEARSAIARAERAAKVLAVYGDATQATLEKVYADVQGNFADLYRKINADDESTFQAELIPSMGKLGFNVDFYTRGYFPPGAYHSEGHQDSMGLCLYLALMKHLLGDGFTVAVLDDVLMSVDAGHRREVSRLLQTEFPGTQFVLTTHDKAWLKYMGATKLVEAKQTVHFRKWTVDDGPTAWGGDGVWAEIRAHVDSDDLRSAASLLRNTMEHLSAEYCQAIRAKVEFSAEGRYDLGDLLPPAIGQMKKLLEASLAAAKSWGDAAKVTAIEARATAFAGAAAKALGEQWQLNPAIHHNDWANFHAKEFLPLVDAFEALAAQFACATCGDLLEVSPVKGSKEHLQCLCGASVYSFKTKPKEKALA